LELLSKHPGIQAAALRKEGKQQGVAWELPRQGPRRPKGERNTGGHRGKGNRGRTWKGTGVVITKNRKRRGLVSDAENDRLEGRKDKRRDVQKGRAEESKRQRKVKKKSPRCPTMVGGKHRHKRMRHL